MVTHKIATSFIPNSRTAQLDDAGLVTKYNAFVDAQNTNAIGWWIGSLMLHGCIFVPLTFLFVYSTGGPAALFLMISMGAFFVNVIANMGGAGFRFTFNSFIASIVLHIIMIGIAVLAIL